MKKKQKANRGMPCPPDPQKEVQVVPTDFAEKHPQSGGRPLAPIAFGKVKGVLDRRQAAVYLLIKIFFSASRQKATSSRLLPCPKENLTVPSG